MSLCLILLYTYLLNIHMGGRILDLFKRSVPPPLPTVCAPPPPQPPPVLYSAYLFHVTHGMLPAYLCRACVGT